MKLQVLTTTTSARSAVPTAAYPARRSRSAIPSPSTAFLGQPRFSMKKVRAEAGMAPQSVAGLPGELAVHGRSGWTQRPDSLAVHHQIDAARIPHAQRYALLARPAERLAGNECVFEHDLPIHCRPHPATVGGAQL